MRAAHARSGLVAAVAMATLTAGLAAPSSAATKQPRTLTAAVAAARADSCPTCVHRTYSRATAKESARRGLVELAELDELGGGAVYLWGYTGTRWRPLAGYQDDVALPKRLPVRMWVCTDDRGTLIRSGPGKKYRVLRTVRHDTRARATQFRLTTSAHDQSFGRGWFRVTIGGRVGWVSSTRVSNDLGCGFWRKFGTVSG